MQHKGEKTAYSLDPGGRHLRRTLLTKKWQQLLNSNYDLVSDYMDPTWNECDRAVICQLDAGRIYHASNDSHLRFTRIWFCTWRIQVLAKQNWMNRNVLPQEEQAFLLKSKLLLPQEFLVKSKLLLPQEPQEFLVKSKVRQAHSIQR